MIPGNPKSGLVVSITMPISRQLLNKSIRRKLSWNLPVMLIVISFAARAYGEVYFCQQDASVSIDPFGVASPAKGDEDFEYRNWIIDTERGWRRSDFPEYRGSCAVNSGYVVCRTDNIAFGEATLSIHPNGSNFAVVYTDYGLGSLTFVGKCSKNDSNSG